MKIAIIGSGISGLTAAYRLQQCHDVTVFEAADRVGGHTNTVMVSLQGRAHAIDTGFIVYNEHSYPLFSALLRELDVETQPTTMSFSVRSERTGLEYNGTSLNQLFSQRSNLARPSFWRMLRDILRFNREGPALSGVTGDLTSVEAYVRREGYSREFFEHYLVPLGASLWSCPPATFRAFPIRFVVEFLQNHAMLQVGGRPVWRVIRGGSYRYVERMASRFHRPVLVNTPVRSVDRGTDGVRVVDRSGQAAWFDHVVFACHADQALRLLTSPTELERDLLAAFPYQPNQAILHTDISALPRKRSTWAAWNYRVHREDPDRVAVTYNMNLLQGLRPEPVFNVTLNDDSAIDENRVLRRISYEHPVYTQQRQRAQSRHHELIGANRTSYCGAYWGYGFHEDGVRSATAVSEALLKEVAA